MQKKRILIIAMQDSPHTFRWLRQLANAGLDVHLFAINSLAPNSDVEYITLHQAWYARIAGRFLNKKKKNGLLNRALKKWMIRICLFIDKLFTTTLGDSEVVVPYFYGPKSLSNIIRKLRPEVIHSLEFQHCSYLALYARYMIGDQFPSWWVTNWGSDIYHFARIGSHKKTIEQVLKYANFYSCECHRDVDLARQLGFSGQILPVIPNSGGFDLDSVQKAREKLPTSARKLILIKGYQTFAGRALTALEALEYCLPELQGYKIVVFSASPETRARVRELLLSTHLDIEILDYASHDVMMRMFARARIYLGVSVSDGISTSMLEAMGLGAFPIQTNTSCCNEWIVDGRSGFEIPPDDPFVIANKLRQALVDDDLVDNASRLNWNTVVSKLNGSVLSSQVIEMYNYVLKNKK